MRDVGRCDRGTTAKLIEKDLAAAGSANNLAAIGPHQAGHGGRGREVNRLLPHSLHDIDDGEDLPALRSVLARVGGSVGAFTKRPRR